MPKAMENHSGENGELCQEARQVEKHGKSDENLIRDRECHDFRVLIDTSKAAKLQRTLKWAGLKLVSRFD